MNYPNVDGIFAPWEYKMHLDIPLFFPCVNWSSHFELPLLEKGWIFSMHWARLWAPERRGSDSCAELMVAQTYYLHVRFGEYFPWDNPRRNACPAFLTAVKTLQVRIQRLDRNIWCSPSLVSWSRTLPVKFNWFSLSDLLTEIISPAVGWQRRWISWT